MRSSARCSSTRAWWSPRATRSGRSGRAPSRSTQSRTSTSASGSPPTSTATSTRCRCCRRGRPSRRRRPSRRHLPRRPSRLRHPSRRRRRPRRPNPPRNRRSADRPTHPEPPILPHHGRRITCNPRATRSFASRRVGRRARQPSRSLVDRARRTPLGRRPHARSAPTSSGPSRGRVGTFTDWDREVGGRRR